MKEPWAKPAGFFGILGGAEVGEEVGAEEYAEAATDLFGCLAGEGAGAFELVYPACGDVGVLGDVPRVDGLRVASYQWGEECCEF